MIKEENGMADKVIVCKDCKDEFVFTESEQAFYREKGFDNEPVRCPACRKARKAEKNNGFGGRDNRSGQGNRGRR
jgi:hypothetical protein